MHVYGELIGTLSGGGVLSGVLSSPKTLYGEMTVPQYIMPPSYEGEYEITPTEETQVLATENHYMTGNVVINPIPVNYGLITWNGNVLTVS